MGRTVLPIGSVLQGEYAKRNIYWLEEESFFIVDKDENGKIITNSWFPTNYIVLKKISKGTVERYECISYNRSPLMNGLIGSIIASAANERADIDVAIYFKDGTKSLICLKSEGAYNGFKRFFFEL